MNRYVNLDEATGLFRGVDVKMVGSFVAYMLESLPAIDIVYCEDCKYWDNRFGLTDTDGSCEYRGGKYNLTDAGYYCASGERREE